jgi:hypothetical protein
MKTQINEFDMLKHMFMQVALLLTLCSLVYATDDDVQNNVGSFGMYAVDYLKKNPDVKELRLFQCIGTGLTKNMRCRKLRDETYVISRDRVFDKTSHCNELAGKIMSDVNWHPGEQPWQFAYHVSDTPDIVTSGYFIIMRMNRIEFTEVTAVSEHGAGRYFWDVKITADLYGYSDRSPSFNADVYDALRGSKTYFKLVPIYEQR